MQRKVKERLKVLGIYTLCTLVVGSFGGGVIGYNIKQPIVTTVTEQVPIIVKEDPIIVEKEPQTIINTLYIPTAIDNETTNSFPLSGEERELIIRVIIQETGWGTFDDMLGIAQVIRDKAEHENTALYHGPNIKEVLANGHANPAKYDLNEFPLVIKAVELVFDYGFRLFDEITTIYFTPETSDPDELEILRQYEYVGKTQYFEFHSDKLKEEDNAT